MMVPGQGQDPGNDNAPAQPQPSQTDFWLALATMHSLGRIAPDTVQPNANPRFDDKGLERKDQGQPPNQRMAQAKPDYEAAYDELEKAPEGSPNVSATAKMLRGKSGVPFPNWSKEENEDFIQKYGPEKAIDALDARMGMIQKNIDRHSAQGTEQDDMDASISKDYLQRLKEIKSKILSDQGS